MTIGTPDSARICRQTSIPSGPAASGRAAPGRAAGRGTPRAPCRRRRRRRLEALAAQHDAEHLRQRGVVVDDQHASLHGAMVSPSRPNITPARRAVRVTDDLGVIALRVRVPGWSRGGRPRHAGRWQQPGPADGAPPGAAPGRRAAGPARARATPPPPGRPTPPPPGYGAPATPRPGTARPRGRQPPAAGSPAGSPARRDGRRRRLRADGTALGTAAASWGPSRASSRCARSAWARCYDGSFQAMRSNPRTMIGLGAVVIGIASLVTLVPETTLLVSRGRDRPTPPATRGAARPPRSWPRSAPGLSGSSSGRSCSGSPSRC